MLNKRQKGDIGEDIAVHFLEKQGFVIRDRNYYKKWGEIDIVAMKGLPAQAGEVLHFFEVKSKVVLSFTESIKAHSPEENVNLFKVKQLRRIIGTYLTDKKNNFEKGLDTPFSFHILSVYMNSRTRKGRVRWIKDVIL